MEIDVKTTHVVEIETGIPMSNNNTDNYNSLTNKPQINGITLNGNKTADELNLQPKGDYATKDYVKQEIATLGIGKWELITEVNLDTETTKYILCSCDEYDKIEIIIKRESNNTALNGNMIFDIVDADGKTLVELYANSNPGYREKFSIMEVNGGYAHCISMSTNNTYASTSSLSRGYYVGKGCKYCLRIPKPNTACDGLSRMTVIGRRK